MGRLLTCNLSSSLKQVPYRHLFRLIPLMGIGLFVLLYVVAAWYYPGGSEAHESEYGFSLANNYWCDLLEYRARNGHYNISRPVALTAMVLLCISLAVFWYYLPKGIVSDPIYHKAIQFSGIFSMISAIFVFTRHHDVVINVAGFFGSIAFLGTFVGLFRTKKYALSWLGIFCFSLCCINYYIFETNHFVWILPVVQKVTFLVCFIWFGLIDIQIYRFQYGVH